MILPDAQVPVASGPASKARRSSDASWNQLCPSVYFAAVRRAARRCGLKEVGEDEEWTVYWTDCSVSLERVMEMKRFQVPSTARVKGAEKNKR